MNNKKTAEFNVDEVLGSHKLKKHKGILYHYTSINSLHSIVENMELWVTHSKFMNDAGESTYFWGIFDEVLEEYLINCNTELKGTFDEIQKNLINTKKIFFELIDEQGPKIDIVYLLSFSMNPNSLSMWNYYGKNDGYCIAMKPSQIEKNWKNKNYGHIVCAPVVYDKKRQKKILMKELNDFIDSIISSQTELTNSIVEDLFIRWVFCYMSFFKHKSFEAENEFRIAFRAVRTPIFYRPYQGAFAPYIKIDLKNDKKQLEIESVTCGPYINHDQALSGLERWLATVNLVKKLTIQNGALTQSDIPIRF